MVLHDIESTISVDPEQRTFRLDLENASSKTAMFRFHINAQTGVAAPEPMMVMVRDPFSKEVLTYSEQNTMGWAFAVNLEQQEFAEVAPEERHSISLPYEPVLRAILVLTPGLRDAYRRDLEVKFGVMPGGVHLNKPTDRRSGELDYRQAKGEKLTRADLEWAREEPRVNDPADREFLETGWFTFNNLRFEVETGAR